MRLDINSIVDDVRLLLSTIEARDFRRTWQHAGSMLETLPADNFADPAPGVTVAMSMPEYTLAKLMPYVRGSVRKWHGWAAEATAESEWPNPDRLRDCLWTLEEIRAQVIEMTMAPVSSEVSIA